MRVINLSKMIILNFNPFFKMITDLLKRETKFKLPWFSHIVAFKMSVLQIIYKYINTFNKTCNFFFNYK